MAMDIFSNFDPLWFNLCLKSSIMIFMPLFMLMTSIWSNLNSSSSIYYPIMSYMEKQILSTKMPMMKGLNIIISTLFIMLIYINMMGMMPYMFSISSHIIFTISLGLPLWLSIILTSYSHSMKKSTAHLLPDGAPMWLNPFLVLVETISIMVRPITLSFRLAANMTAGHVVLTLINSFSVSNSIYSFSMMMAMSSMYMLFELAICMIQAYIFCLLLTLYSNEHA